jgi:hypothetical protein
MANIDIQVTTPPDTVMTQVVLDMIAATLTRAASLAASPIQRRVVESITNAVRNSPAYLSLVGGQLKGELGVIDALPILEAVVANLANGVQVNSRRFSPVAVGVLEGGLYIEIFKGDYEGIVESAGGYFQSEGGFPVSWLRWLTLEGERILVSDHQFVATPTPYVQRGGRFFGSRTGLGLMRRGGSWRVPPEFQGTEQDNWLSRALLGTTQEVGEIVAQELERAL